MASRLLSHIRGNAIAWLALFIALSGTAYAAGLPKNSVGTKQIKKSAVTGSKVKKDSLTGTNIKESSLGTVPKAIISEDAVTLAGNPPSSFLGAGATAANADKWDGIDSSVFGTKIVVSGTSFDPRSSAGRERVSEGTGSMSCTGTPDDFIYRVQLPQGASVTGVDYRYLDNDGGANSGLSLIALNSFDGSGLSSDTIASAASTGASAGNRTASGEAPAQHSIDNGKYSYVLVWSPFLCGPTMQIRGAAVRYTLPTS